MPAVLEYRPPDAPIDFGDALVGNSNSMFHNVNNIGTSALTVTSMTMSDSHFKFVDSLDGGVTYRFCPFTVNPGFSSGPWEVTFTPTSAPATFNGSVTIVSNDPGGPQVHTLTGDGIAGGSKALTVVPPSHYYGSVLVGDTSAEQLFRVTSTGEDPVTVQAPTIPVDFIAGSTVPSYPITIPFNDTLEFVAGGDIDYVGGGAIEYVEETDFFDFGVAFKPLTPFNIVETMDVNSDADDDPFEVQLSGYGTPIVPVNPVNGNLEQFLVATREGEDTTVLMGDPDDLDCEVNAFVLKLHNFQLPGVDKTTYAMYLHYEDLGEVDLTLTLSSPDDAVIEPVSAGTVGADEDTKLIKAVPMEVQGELIRLRIDKDADDGPLSLVDYIIRHEPFAVRKGESPIPDDVTSVFPVTGVESFLIFIADMDDAILAVDNERLEECGLDPYACVAVCPLPRKISAKIGSDPAIWGGNCRPGPFVLDHVPSTECIFGTRFAGIFRLFPGIQQLDYWVSDDMGFSWAVVDAANAPTSADDYNSYDVEQAFGIIDAEANILHIATQDASGKVRYHQASLTTKTWILVDDPVNGDGSDAATAGSFACAITLREDGSPVIAYNSNRETDGAPRDRCLMRVRTAGVWGSAIQIGRHGVTDGRGNSIQRLIPGASNRIHIFMWEIPGALASSIDDDVQTYRADNTLSAYHRWQGHGISGVAQYGRPWVSDDLTNFILPLRDSGEADLHFFTSSDDITTETSVTDLGELTQYGVFGSGNATMIAGKISNTTHSLMMPFFVTPSSSHWVYWDTVAGVPTLKTSPEWSANLNKSELAGSIRSLYGGTWLMYFAANLDPTNGTFFFLQNIADLDNIDAMTISAWEAALPSQDAEIPYTATGCNLMLEADPDDLRAEKLPYWEKTFDYNLPEVGAVRDYEKSLYRLYVYYEDIGEALVKVIPTTRRGQTYAPQTIGFGTPGGEGQPKVAIFDIAITDVLIKLRCEVVCGQVSIIMFSCEFEPKGRLVKNT